MKKLYSLLTLIVCLLCSVGAKATPNAPALSSDDTEYQYYIHIAATGGVGMYLATSNSETTTPYAIYKLTIANYTEYTKAVFIIKASSTAGYYNMYLVSGDDRLPIYVSDSKLYAGTTDNTPADFALASWTSVDGFSITVKGSNYTLYHPSTQTAEPYNAGFAASNSTNNWHRYVFEPVSELDDDVVTAGNTAYTNIKNLSSLQSTYSTYKTTLENASSSYGTLGYPTSTAVTTFTTAADALINNPTATQLGESDLATQYNSLITTMLESITMPEAGHIYKIQPVFSDGTTYELYWDGTNASRINGDTEANLASNKSTYFYCGTSDSQYFFVNKDGKYLNWFDPGSAGKGYNDVGATDEYNATYNLWTLEPADPINGTVYLGSGSTATATSATALAAWSDMLGRFQMKANGASAGTTYYLVPRYPGDGSTTMDFVSSGSDNKYYDAPSGKHRTYTFKLEEVTDYTPMVLNDGGDGYGYGTYSSPFPFILPSGVTAYIATAESQYDGTEKVIHFDNGYATAGTTVPEGLGLLLKGIAGSYIPVPSTGTGTTADNILVATGGDGMTVAENSETNGKAYILGRGNSGTGEVGFYLLSSTNRTLNPFRAYLKLSYSDEGASSSEAIKISFDDMVNGIDAIVTNDVESSNAPLYDLSGRRVSAPVKGSLYIQNGKKYIAR